MSDEVLSYYARNKDDVKAKVKAYADQHREKYRAYCREYYRLNKEKIQARQKKYRETYVRPKKEKKVRVKKEKVKKQPAVPLVVASVSEVVLEPIVEEKPGFLFERTDGEVIVRFD